uniref:Low density lipoprotein receptor class A domain containing 1 n=1 Tax=Junco hyemalis TaxID=40217 RepID=A0A8C5I8Y0_JUNHY
EVFNGGVWLFKLNSQPLTPSSPHAETPKHQPRVPALFPCETPQTLPQPLTVSLASPGCCHRCGARPGCTQRRLCISALALLALAAAVASVVAALALLPRAPVNRLCTAPNNRTGFLCDDRVTCVPASWVCDRVSNCRNGEDEQEQLCGDLPHSLPGYLVFYCSNPRSWVYADQRCNGMNDCGDCSDESWSCKSVCWLLSFC